MARQYRGCSRLVYAPYTYDAEKDTVEFGTVKKLCEVKSISREVSSEKEEIWADNKLQDTTYGGTSVTRTFSCMRVSPEVEAELLGKTVVEVGAHKLYGTAPDGSKRPYIAIGYALHDGEVNKPCEVVWGYKAVVNSISQTANTIDRGTASEGQEVNVTFSAPDKAWTKTSNNELDMAMPITDANKTLVEKWFTKVITPDNAATELGVTGS
jgi:phi13 family phage major tail protein